MGSIISSYNDNNFDSVKSKYFNSVNQIINQHYESNITPKRLNANASICFENKSFDGVYASEETQAQSYIEWLQYLYNYLTIEIGDKEWAQEMIILLDDELFLSENKYLSQFFFRDFFMSLEPNCIKDSKNNNSVNVSGDIKIEMFNESNQRNYNSSLFTNEALIKSIGQSKIIDKSEQNIIDEGIEIPVIPKVESKRMTREELEEQKMVKIKMLSAILDKLAVVPTSSPVKARNFAMACKPQGVRLAWVCNYKHAMHSSPCGCAKPHLGGKWVVLGKNSKEEIKDDK